MKKLDTVLSHLFTAEARAEIRQRAKEKLGNSLGPAVTKCDALKLPRALP